MRVINILNTLILTTTIGRATLAYTTTSLFNSYVYESLANTISQYAEKWGLYKYKTDVSKSTYDFIFINLSPEIADFGSHLAKNFHPALNDAILLDGILLYTLGVPILHPIIGSTIAYDLRKSINSYFENSKLHGVAGGVFAGAIKYGVSKSTINPKILLIGAVNNALYEYFKPEFGATITNADAIGLYVSLTLIEGVDAVLKFALTHGLDHDPVLGVERNLNSLLEQTMTTLKVAGSLSASTWIFLEDEGEFTWTLGRTLSIPNKVIDDIAYTVNYVINLQKPIPNTNAQCALKNFTKLDTCPADEYYDELVQNTELNNGVI